MKKSLFVLALAVLLVFAYAALAGAKYAGAFVDGSLASSTAAATATPGYLSWGGATKLMAQNSVSADLQSTAHGGYTTATTKCAVCHSAHRAIGIGQLSSPAPTSNSGGNVNNFLTAGGSSCVQCHTAWGSTNSGLLVEWAKPDDGAAGPHNSGGCTTCHAGGIHGGSNSQYWGMNAYMLGGSNDAQITQELPLQTARQDPTGQVGAGTALVTDPGTRNTGTGTGSAWFVDGSTVNTAVGSAPPTSPANPVSMPANIYAAARSLLTGYTCSRAGCHINSVFANLTWGQSYERRQGATSGSDTTAPLMMTTGHSTAPAAEYNSSNANGCSPCHAGNPAGGYRLTLYSASANGSARAYGCDQCHDAVGVATNSTAFPHGNRNIQVYEWKNGVAGASVYQAPTTTTARAGNIWMYQANMMSTDGSPNTLVDPSVTLIQDSVGGAEIGKVVDGECLKCHVPGDAQSAAAWGLTFTPDQTPRIGAGHHGLADIPSNFAGLDISTMNPYTGGTPDGRGATDALLFLWK